MKSLLLLTILGLCSCVQLQYSAQTPKGTETFAYNSFGGSGALDSAGGTRLTHNHNKTAGQFFQTVASVAGGVSASVAAKSTNALEAAKSTNAAGVANNANNNATSVELAKIAAEAEAAKLAKP